MIKEELNSKIKNLHKKKIFQIYFVFFLLVIIASVVFCEVYTAKFEGVVDENFNIIFKNISFHHGLLIENLFYNGKFEQDYLGVPFVLLKMPFLPVLLTLISKISTNFYFIIIFKNLIFFSIFFLIIFFCLRSLNFELKYFLIFLGLLFYNPYNLFTALNFEYEDFLIIIFLPSLFCLLISNLKNRYHIIAVIIFCLYLTKTSMFFLSITLPFLIIFYERSSDQKIKKFIPIFGLFFAIFLWGSFGYIKTGKFPFGSNLTSINSNALSVVLNKEFKNIYPHKSVDLIDEQYQLPENIRNEWEFYNYFQMKNDEYLNSNLKDYLKDNILKIKFIFFGIHKDSVFPDINGKFHNPIRFSNIPNKIFINISLILAIIILFKNLKKFYHNKVEVYFLSIFGLNIFTHILAWATSKHLVAISIISSFYLVFKLVEKNKN